MPGTRTDAGRRMLKRRMARRSEALFETGPCRESILAFEAPEQKRFSTSLAEPPAVFNCKTGGGIASVNASGLLGEGRPAGRILVEHAKRQSQCRSKRRILLEKRAFTPLANFAKCNRLQLRTDSQFLHKKRYTQRCRQVLASLGISPMLSVHQTEGEQLVRRDRAGPHNLTLFSPDV